MAGTTTKSCRICLQKVKEDAPYHFLNNEGDLMLLSKLLEFFPKFDLNIIQNPITCSQCMRMINDIHEFKQLCVRTESILRNISLHELLDNALHIFKKGQSDRTINEEFVEDPINNELFSLQNVENECLQINTDMPMCSEESTGTKVSYYCNNCNYCTDKKKNLIKHVSTHQNKILRKKCFKRARTYSMPILKTHKQKFQPKAIKVEYATDSETELITPVRTQTEQKPFHCIICEHQATSLSSLKTHLHTHTRDKPFCCNICNCCTNEMSVLEKHLRTHIGDKPFCCSICGYCCSSRANLKKHSLTHTGEKPFSCNMCSYRSNQSSNLNRHLLTHNKV